MNFFKNGDWLSCDLKDNILFFAHPVQSTETFTEEHHSQFLQDGGGGGSLYAYLYLPTPFLLITQ